MDFWYSRVLALWTTGVVALGATGVVDYALGIWAIGVVHLLKPAGVGDYWRCGLCFGDMGDRCCALAQAC